MRVLVTGASGKVGSLVVWTLQSRGVQVRPASRRTDPPLDWRAPETWAPALAGTQAVFLAVPGGDDGHRGVDHEVANAAGFVEAAGAAGVERIVLLSALGMEHAPPDVPLRAVESAVQEHLPRWTILRPNWFFENLTAGPLRALAAAGGGRLALPIGDAAISFVHAGDVAEVAVAALAGGHDGAEYDLTGPESLRLQDLVDTIRNVVEADWSAVTVDEVEFRETAADLGWEPAYVDTLCELFRAIRDGRAAEVSDDVPQVLGRAARSLETFVATNAAALRAVPSIVPG